MSSFLTNLLGGAQNYGIKSTTDLISGVPNQQPNANKQTTGGLQQFLSDINSNNGLYRSVFFEVVISKLRETGATQAMSLLCHQASLPGFRLETRENIIYALPYETPIGVSFDPCWMTFYIDNAFTIPSILWDATFNTNPTVGRINQTSWSPKYRDPATLLEVQINAFAPSTASGNAQYKTVDGLPIIAQYTLKNAFIKTVQQTPLDWSAHNDLSSVVVEFSYEWVETKFPGNGVQVNTNSIKAQNQPLNFDTIMAKYPALGIGYDAAKRTILQNTKIMNNPLLNQGSNFLP